MKQHDKERLKYGLLLSPLAIIAFLVLIVPIISIVLGSLKEDGSSTYSLYNYMYILGSKFYKQSFTNSIKISLISSILGIVISFQLAYSISKLNNSIKDVVLLYSNMMSNFSGLPLAFALIVILGTNGAITLILQKIGISEFNI